MFRVIWRYGADTMGPLTATNVPATPLALRSVDPLFADCPLVGVPEPVFQRPALELRARLLALPESLRAEPRNDLAAYHHGFVEEREVAELLRERLLNEPGVESAEVQPRPVPAFFLDESRHARARQAEVETLHPSLHPSATASYRELQGYLDPSPDGIDAAHAWTVPGGLGDGLHVVDVESGWNFQHEDLTRYQVGVTYGNNGALRGHGTAVLGIIGGDHNGFGVMGIAPRAVCSAHAAEIDASGVRWNAEEAIRAAADRLSPGDVILLEMHGSGPNADGSYAQHGFIPVEYWEATFAAVQHAVGRGIHVVAAAGNGSEDLDDAAYDGRFSRAQRDSGAILVGAGGSASQPDARSRLWWSNYGSRVDVQGWGEDIVTTGSREAPRLYDLRDDPDPSRCYTQSFGGTSGASPIVVGAVLAIEGCLRATARPALTPTEMRELLVPTGTQQTDGPNGPASSQHIGPLPDLKRALAALGLT